MFLAIKNVLANCFICPVNSQEVVTIFHCMGFPDYVGAVDGPQILILCLLQGAHEFISHKGFFSVVLQGVINHQGCPKW